MTVSSKYSPEPSFVDVPAHPSREASRMTDTSVKILLESLMAMLLMKDSSTISRGQGKDRFFSAHAPYASEHRGLVQIIDAASEQTTFKVQTDAIPTCHCEGDMMSTLQGQT